MDYKERIWVETEWIHPDSGDGQVVSPCEYSNKPSVSIKCRELLD
jgi:hypothetical protein